MKRYFIDGVSEINVSDDGSVVSITCGNFSEGEMKPEFQIVLPARSFVSLSKFFNAAINRLTFSQEEVKKTNNSSKNISTSYIDMRSKENSRRREKSERNV